MDNTILPLLRPVELSPLESGQLDIFGFYGKQYLIKRDGDDCWVTATENGKRKGLRFGRQLDEAWADKEMLVGCRFYWRWTGYAMIDIDKGSVYHNLESLADIKAALEEIGIVRTILVRSSASEGWHLYIPLGNLKGVAHEAYGRVYFPDRLAWAVRKALAAYGFELAAGQLELFPNIRARHNDSCLFNGHRLPLQEGSYVLDSEALPVHQDLAALTREWVMCAEGQDHETLRTAEQDIDWKRDAPKSSSSAESIVELEEGWTGKGQTNDLLLAAVRYICSAGELSQEQQAPAVVKMLRSLPGYDQHCGHKSQLESRARVAVRCWLIKSSKSSNISTPMGVGAGQVAAGAGHGSSKGSYRLLTRCDKHRRSKGSNRQTTATKMFNRMKTEDVQARIKQAVDNIPYQLGESLTEYRQKIKEMSGAGIPALTKHKKLWHPSYKAG